MSSKTKVTIELPGGWTVFDHAPSAMAVASRAGTLLRANAALGRLVGRDPTDLVGLELLALLDPAGREAVCGHVEHGSGTEVIPVRRPDGTTRWLHVEATVIEEGDAVIGHVTDVTARQAVREDLERDPVTGLLARRRLEDDLDRFLAEVRRHGRQGALVLLGIDDLDAHAAAHGHAATERALRFVAATVHARTREEDTVARVRPDQIAVLLADSSSADAVAVAEELVALLGAPRDRTRPLVARGGVVPLDPDLPGAVAALQAADLVLATAEPGTARLLTDERPGDRPASRAAGLLDGLRAVAIAPSLSGTLKAVRELLGMDVSYLTRHTETEQVFVELEGDGASFGVGTGTRLDLAQTYCRRILAGELPPAMPDVRDHPAAMALPVTQAAGVGAFASVPVQLSDGTLFGTLCAASHGVVPELDGRDLQFLHVLARMVAGELERDAALREQLRLRVQAAGADALLSAVEARDRYTGAHSREVVELAEAVARQLELDAEAQHEVAQVALLHDIGKLAVPDAVLGKPGPLDPDEQAAMRRHPEDGERIVAAIPELRHLAPAIRAEHERWDGGGYPDGLTGLQIPVASRIVLVCDAFHAMTSDRPYRSRLTREAAIAELADHAGTQFCPTSVDALFGVLARG